MILKLGEQMKNILVTGGAGFIGSHFIKFILKKYDNYSIVNFDLLTYAANLSNLSSLIDDPRYTFFKGNICDKESVTELFNRFHFDYVINFAAESHVDRSIESPIDFIKTNILGTQTLLDVAKNHWEVGLDSGIVKFIPNVKFIQISTDEVYGSLGPVGQFTEENPLLPNSPYAASKASADMLVRSFYKTYGFPMNITRCSNNYGENQFPEKLIPLMISHAK